MQRTIRARASHLIGEAREPGTPAAVREDPEDDALVVELEAPTIRWRLRRETSA